MLHNAVPQFKTDTCKSDTQRTTTSLAKQSCTQDMDIPQPMIVMEARPTFVRVPQTGDELALWRQQSGLSLAKAAKKTGAAYNTFKAYEQRGHRKIPKHMTLACAAIDAGVIV